MRTKVTLVLLFLNVALFFFIFGFEREWRIKQEAQRSRSRVLGAETANIQSLQIAGAAVGEPIRLERRADGWMLTSPMEWPADPHAVSRIINEMQFLEHYTSFAVSELETAGQSLSDYGLDEPPLRLSFTPAAPSGDPGAAPGDEVTLAMGSETPVGNRLYLLSPDEERVHVVDRSLADSLRVAMENLRATTCFTIPAFEVRSLNLQTAGPANARVRLRREGNRWSFEAPINARASKTNTELAINELNALRTHRFLGSVRSRPELAGQAGTQSPTLRVTLEANARRETLLVGERAPVPEGEEAAKLAEDEVLYYAQMEDRDAIFTVAMPTGLLETLRNAQEELRDPRILPLEGMEVTALNISAPNLPTLTLQRLEASTGNGPNWQIVRSDATGGPQTRPADAEVVQRLLQHLTLLSATSFLRDVPSESDLENWGLTRPEREITLHLTPEGATGGVHTVKLLLGVASEREGRVYAKLANQPFVYLVSPDILRVTPVVPRAYRDRLLRDLRDQAPGPRILALSITDLSRDEVLYSHTLTGTETWDQVFEEEPPERAAALKILRTQLRTLRAQRFVGDAFAPRVPVQGEERAWAYQVEIALALNGGGNDQLTRSQLFFAPRAGGTTQLVGSPDAEFDVIFEAEQPLLDAMWVLTRPRETPEPPAVEPAEPSAPPAAEPEEPTATEQPVE